MSTTPAEAVWASDNATGSGFYCEAYGGDADIVFATTAHAARARLTERARELLDAEKGKS